MLVAPEAERHRGLTYFLLATDSRGVTVRPIPQIDGEPGFAEIFFESVFVPDSQVLGGVGTSGTGLAGIEYEFNSVLRGTPGVQHVVFKAPGRGWYYLEVTTSRAGFGAYTLRFTKRR